MMSEAPSCAWYGRPKYSGWSSSWLLPSLSVLWSIHTFVAPDSEIRSYSEFQLPAEPSVGSHAGKQSAASVTSTFRMITLLTPVRARLPWVSRPPSIPMIVVLLPTLIFTVAPWFLAERARASSSGPLGLVVVPQTAGSYAARNASRV